MIGIGPIGASAIGEAAGGGGEVSASLNLAYNVGGLVSADLVLGYNVGFSVPYAIPMIPFTSVLIGTNNANSLKDAGWTDGQWEGAIFSAYGGGGFINKYSGIGAYVLGGMGGHQHKQFYDLIAFNYAVAAWEKRANANGLTNSFAGGGVNEASTTGTPYYEMPASSPAGAPAPAHNYALNIGIDDGTQGSLMRLVGDVVTGDTTASTRSTHCIDANTGLWTRYTNSLASRNDNAESTAVFDANRNRWYYVENALGPNTLAFLDAATKTWADTPTFPYPSQAGTGSGKAAIVPGTNFMIHCRRDLTLQGIDLTSDATIALGFTMLNTTGSVTVSNGGASWVPHPGDGTLWQRPDGLTVGNKINILKPPAGNLKTGTWTFSTVDIGGAGLPINTLSGAGGGGDSHYTGLHFIKAYNRMGWVSGPGQVAVIAGSLGMINADLPLSYNVSGYVSADLPLNYGVAGPVNADLPLAYGVSGQVSGGLALSYSVAAFVSTDLTLGYAISAFVSADLPLAYGLAGFVSSDLGLAFGVNAFVSANLSLAYLVALASGGGPLATYISETFQSAAGGPRLNLTGMRYYVWSQVGATPLGAPIAQGLVNTDVSGGSFIDITGQTSVISGAPVTLGFSNATADPAQEDLMSWFGTVVAH